MSYTLCSKTIEGESIQWCDEGCSTISCLPTFLLVGDRIRSLDAGGRIREAVDEFNERLLRIADELRDNDLGLAFFVESFPVQQVAGEDRPGSVEFIELRLIQLRPEGEEKPGTDVTPKSLDLRPPR